MEYVEAVIKLLAGLGTFLIAFKLLSDNIEKLANGFIKKVFNKTANNRFIGVGIGAAVTAIIQSSSATTVMIVGFVNSGLMSLFQATSMIMGANIGTTITAHISSLGSLDITLWLLVLAPVGIFMSMFSKNDKVKTIGLALGGLGLVFLGLEYMSSSMEVFKKSTAFTNILQSCTNPMLLLLIGAGFTAVIQSSSAVATIIITMVGQGLTIGNGGNDILFVILGSNIGTCVTALLSSIGASKNAIRTALIHLMFNLFGTILFVIMLLIWKDFNDMTFVKWIKNPEMQIAWFHTFFNVLATLIFLPFINGFVKLAKILVRDKKTNEIESQTDFTVKLEERFLQTPAIAIANVSQAILGFGGLCMNTLDKSITAFLNKDTSKGEEIKNEISNIEILNKNIIQYLIKVSSSDITDKDEVFVSNLHHIINDFYREAEIADNMVKYTKNTVEDSLQFSEDVYNKISKLRDMLLSQYANVQKLMTTNDYLLVSDIDSIEEEIDTLRSNMINEHIKRLELGECSPNNSGVYINLVSNLERAGDHLNYIAHLIVSE